MTKDKTAVERVRKYHNRLKERGFVRVTVWVLARDAELIREVARDLKEAAENSPDPPH